MQRALRLVCIAIIAAFLSGCSGQPTAAGNDGDEAVDELAAAVASHGIGQACSELATDCAQSGTGCRGHERFCERDSLCLSMAIACNQGNSRSCDLVTDYCSNVAGPSGNARADAGAALPPAQRLNSDGGVLPGASGSDASTLDPTVDPPPDLPPSQPGLRAFPGAEGFAATEVTGGRGGKVYIVNTLKWYGEYEDKPCPDGAPLNEDGNCWTGLADALFYREGPRTIVFEVSGVIDPINHPDKGYGELQGNNSDVTVAGQSSPGGVTLTGLSISQYKTEFHNAVFRFLRFRGNDNGDNVSFNKVHHLIIDHCDFSGATDEALDITFGEDIIIQWSTVSLGKEKGILLAYPPTTRISFHHNLTAHHNERCAPYFHWQGGVPSEGALIDLRNNLFYNCYYPQPLDVRPLTSDFGGGIMFNIVGNTALAGPSTPAPGDDDVAFASLPDQTQVYLGQPNTNIFQAPGGGGNTYDMFTPYVPNSVLRDTPFDFPPVTTQSRADAYDLVMQLAGAWPRDALNTCVVEQIEATDPSKKGSVVGHDYNLYDEQKYPMIRSGDAPPADTDRDGMADAWEVARGLDPDDGTDHANVVAEGEWAGFTQLEVYLHELAVQKIGVVKHACPPPMGE